MSAFISVPYADRVEVISDGATCLPSGLLIAKTEKIRASKRIPLACIGRGRHVELMEITDWILSLEGDVDQVVGTVAQALEQGLIGQGEYPYEMALAALSEADGPTNYLFSSRGYPNSHWGVIPPLTLWHCGDAPLVMGPDITPADAGLATDAGVHGLRQIAVPLFDAMRTRAKALDSEVNEFSVSREAYWIGAHIDHATIDADGVRVERIHEWPDQLFQRIQPK